VLVCLCAVAIAQKAPPGKPFERFDGCVLEPNERTDGDSFRVRLPDGRFETFRLYFVDTTESRSRGERSDAQATYFGLTRARQSTLGGRRRYSRQMLLHPNKSAATHPLLSDSWRWKILPRCPDEIRSRRLRKKIIAWRRDYASYH
jgi:hypothetical protein